MKSSFQPKGYAAFLIYTLLERTSGFDPKSLNHAVPFIRNTFASEVNDLAYFEVPKAHAALFNDQIPFGEPVIKKFPKAAYDIEQAAKCIALDRATACVFHLMRAMEIAVQKFAKQVKAPAIDFDKDTWGDILGKVGPVIRRLAIDTPYKQRRKLKLENIYNHLDHVKRAWRNPTMHPKKQYDPTEAMEIFSAVRVFMRDLAKEI